MVYQKIATLIYIAIFFYYTSQVEFAIIIQEWTTTRDQPHLMNGDYIVSNIKDEEFPDKTKLLV